MKIIAMIKSDVVVNIAVWDGLRRWQPILGGECDSTVDVTGTPVGVGWGWNAGTLTFSGPSGEQIAVSGSSVDMTQ